MKTTDMVKIKFWMKGSGGSRQAEKIVEFSPEDTKDEDYIRDCLENWLEILNCNSEYIRYGWDQV